MKRIPIQSAIVVPCFNEASRLPVEDFRRFAEGGAGRIFLFVNDGSTDGTGEVLTDLHRCDPHRFRVLALDRNMGKGEAVRQGMRHATGLDAPYVGFWDSDLSTPLDVLPEFEDILNARQNVRAVIGSRVRLLGRRIERRAARHYLGRIFATGASLTLGLPIYDTQCGAKLFRNDASFEGLLRQPFRSRWIFDVELLARMVEADGSKAVQNYVCEVPLLEWHDVHGSKLGPGSFVRSGLDLVSLWVRFRSAGRSEDNHL